MKKINLYLLAFLMIATTALQSCGDDGYSLDDFIVSMATVRVISGSQYYLEVDNGETLFPAASNVQWYKPLDGQRVIANYTLLSRNYGDYDYGVLVNFVSNVLTKNVEDLTEADEEKYGNDPVSITDIWVGGKYLNVEFIFDIPSQYKHRVSLVNNKTEEWEDDGYIHLEYRYNDQDDVTGIRRRGIVSFYLGDYMSEDAVTEYRGIKIKTNPESDTAAEVWTFDFNKSDVAKAIKDPDEIVDPEGKIE